VIHGRHFHGLIFAPNFIVKLGSMYTTVTRQAAETVCPGCGQAIPLEDINVAKDVALCRACGKTWSFSLANATRELKDVDLQNPPKGVRVETDFEGATKIIYKRVSPVAIFLILFTALWGGGSMTGIYGTQIKHHHFNLAQSLFGVPFLLGTIVLCLVTAFALLGRWEIKIRRGEGSVFVGVGPLGWRRRFTAGPDALASLQMSSVRVNNQPQETIAIQQGEETKIAFGATIPHRDVKLFIAASLSRALR
jgi:hypothetical protein